MDYGTWVLDTLLTRYEKSRAFVTGTFSRRIFITMEKEKLLEHALEDPDEKQVFFDALRRLKGQGMIDYSWVKYEKGNLVDKIWLIPEEEAIESCYRKLGRIPQKNKLYRLEEQIRRYRARAEKEGVLGHFLDEMLKELSDAKRVPRFFTDDERLNEDILKCLAYMEGNHDEVMERVLSSGLYGDSKYFERNVRGKVISILKYWKKGEEDIPEDQELLGERGIVRWPEIMEFAGNVKVLMNNGDVIDYCTQRYGAYINSDTIKQVKEAVLEGIRQIMFIENKANYIWYLSHEKRDDELVVFHGGCYSPVKGMWFRKLYEGSRREKETVRYFHWSDIDIGGFRIFCRLKESIIPELQPFWMDEAALTKFKEKALRIEGTSYRERLKVMGEDPAYGEFGKVIEKMLQWGIRLEQERMIVGISSAFLFDGYLTRWKI